MGTYAYELKEATTFINKENFEQVLFEIKLEVETSQWAGYGWRDHVLDAKTLEDVAKIFGIQLIDEGDGNYRPVINDVYVSQFFDYLIDIVAPYMSDGEIQVNDGYDVVIIEFKDGKEMLHYKTEEEEESKMTPREVATWLNSECSDEEFIETFALLYKAMDARGIPKEYNKEIMIASLEIEGLCRKLWTILHNYQGTNNKED